MSKIQRNKRGGKTCLVTLFLPHLEQIKSHGADGGSLQGKGIYSPPPPPTTLLLCSHSAKTLHVIKAVCVQSLSHVRLLVTPRTVAHQAPLSREFSMQEFWSGLSFPPPGDFPHLGMGPMSPKSPALVVSCKDCD